MESNRIQKSRVTAIRFSSEKKKKRTNEFAEIEVQNRRFEKPSNRYSNYLRPLRNCYETRGGKINPIVISFGINEGVRFFRPLF